MRLDALISMKDLFICGFFLLASSFADASAYQVNPHPSQGAPLCTRVYPASPLTLYTGLEPVHFLEVKQRLEFAGRKIGRALDVIPLNSQRALIKANQEGDGDAARVRHIHQLVPAQHLTHLRQLKVPVTRLEFIIYSLQPELVKAHWAQLRQTAVGVRKGVRLLQFQLPQAYVSLNPETLFRLLLKGDLQALVMDRLTAESVLANFTWPLRLHVLRSPPLAVEALYPLIHQCHQAEIPALEAALLEVAPAWFQASEHMLTP
ncbi:hypothetical protein SAMN05421831_101442 [Allopseudospirillum japonicum]|uniref:Solute-binding protein family 3/N-terminal domain-containing protein n=2 Tax=Allopseudospirillum japonicum TaxID=64971 RepID=A0A1H6QER0_9GAMM|nr:hypothetical protein SAMN05421831_101442 [Allopseudospirillum japonicum]